MSLSCLLIVVSASETRAQPSGVESIAYRSIDAPTPAFRQAEREEAGDAAGDAPDTTATATGPQRRKRSRFYFGGNIGFTLYGSYTRFSVQPLVGYKITPKTSIGIKGDYQYLSDRRRSPRRASNNYGGSLFSRYRFVPGGFAQAEFALISYDLIDERATVPFLLLGGGYSRPLGNGVWLVVEFLMDVIQDRNSPFRRWEPRVNVGINAGF